MFASPLGPLALVCNADYITELHFLSADTTLFAPTTPLATRCVQLLEQYFTTGKLPKDLPILPKGTPFQLRVWQALQQIPDGKTKTYGELAKDLQTSARAIGSACRTNPLPIVIPCHRIVSQRNLGGYMGATAGECLHNKQYLLDLENSIAP
ncbi:MAG: methylated-DNA--[protein]-cysteine S-methyltransferase [Pseudomonadota bacterium]|nr:methylated-DNA--[protein]-cysteine S-methyltransferase [Pseudomonadota bacterium]